jgi:hypothetical protein
MSEADNPLLLPPYPRYCVIGLTTAGVISCHSQHSSYEGALKESLFWNTQHAARKQVQIFVIPFELEIL